MIDIIVGCVLSGLLSLVIAKIYYEKSIGKYSIKKLETVTKKEMRCMHYDNRGRAYRLKSDRLLVVTLCEYEGDEENRKNVDYAFFEYVLNATKCHENNKPRRGGVIQIRYASNLIEEFDTVDIDGARLIVPIPEEKFDTDNLDVIEYDKRINNRKLIKVIFSKLQWNLMKLYSAVPLDNYFKKMKESNILEIR